MRQIAIIMSSKSIVYNTYRRCRLADRKSSNHYQRHAGQQLSILPHIVFAISMCPQLFAHTSTGIHDVGH